MLTYGWRGNRALAALINESDRRALWREYLATIAHSIGGALYGKNYTLPAYHELLHTGAADERSGEEIVNDIISRLKGGC